MSAGSRPRTWRSCVPTGASARRFSRARGHARRDGRLLGSRGGLRPPSHGALPAKAGAAQGGGGGTNRVRGKRMRDDRGRGKADPDRRGAGGVGAALRMQGGHLPHLHRKALLGPRARSAQRKGVRAGGGDGPDLHQRARGRSRGRPMTTKEEQLNTTEIQSPLAHLTPEQIDELEAEFNAIHHEVFSELGDRDRRYIEGMIEMHRRLGVLGRVLLVGSRFKPAWVAGTSALSLAKILENMEIGHNVLHGQWDWMNDPVINSSTWDWDTASTSEAWKHSHNYIHHTYTNIRGKDRDLGYEIMRIDPQQPWHPVYLLQPLYNVLLMILFEWGVALHDMDLEAFRKGEKSAKEMWEDLKGISGKARAQVTKDYVAWPLVSGLVMTGIDFVVAAAGGDLGAVRARPR